MPQNKLQSTDGNGGLVQDRAMLTTSVEAEPMDGGLSYHADIFKNGILVCRIALSGNFESEAAVEIELNRRLGRWVAEYALRSEKTTRDSGELSSPSDSP